MGAPPVSESSPVNNVARAMKTSARQGAEVGNCKRIFWFSYFFDGTGNNLEADIGLSKHSCVARLFLVHKPANFVDGVFPVYIPGLGTYFPEKGDDGGTLGKAFAAGGDKRLEFALEEFDRLLKKPLKDASNPANSIKEINFAVFGFSRGAALARAFVNKFMRERCVLQGARWKLRTGGWPVRFRFMGIFDTVASVGNPMSMNNTDYYNPAFSDARAIVAERLEDFPRTRPDVLAFSLNAVPGADPAPGRHAGHTGWGSDLRIHETIEEVWHFVAAHESRNSFPLDSISVIAESTMLKPEHFHEVLYLGAHSDVGGGYAPGESGKSLLPSENLCLIPLRHMYNHALRKGVPMSVEWTERNKDDFRTDAKLVETYNYYLKAIGPINNLGDGLIKHMRFYFAWRFKMIRRKIRRGGAEGLATAAQSKRFEELRAVYEKDLARASGKEALATVSRNAWLEVESMAQAEGGNANIRVSPSSGALAKAERELQQARAARLRAQSKRDAVPDMSFYQDMQDFLDRQLLDDVEAICSAMRRSSAKDGQPWGRKDLRPHYAALLEAWENEFIRNNGLKDETIIDFFNKYVHDSIAGFAKDATLPSDPRVVYVGEDIKLRFARLEEGDLRAKAQGVA